MKRGVLLISLVLILFISLGFTYIDSSDINNVARIVDFDNDGDNELIAFSDRIDTRLKPLEIIELSGESSPLTFFGTNLKQCALDYHDTNKDGRLDIAITCFNSSDNSQFKSGLFTSNETNYFVPFIWDTLTPDEQVFSQNEYADILFKDFTHQNYADVLSCFYTTNGNLTLFISDGTSFTSTDSGIKPPTSQCSLVPIDFNGDGYLDVITYGYDDNYFTLYQNTQNTPLFEEITNETFYNKTFFESTLIKSLRAFDNNSDGYPELYYVVDLNNTPQGQDRNISFGYLPNTHRLIDHNLSISQPIVQVNYSFSNFEDFHMSWLSNQNQSSIDISINAQMSNTTNTITSLYYNLEVLDYDNNIVINGQQAESNYDYNSGLGNLQNRPNVSLNLIPQFMRLRAQAIGQNLLTSEWSEEVNFDSTITYFNGTDYISQTIEFCDGLDNDGDGQIDENFNFVWPNGDDTIIVFDADGDGRYPLISNVSHASYKITIDCNDKYARSGQTKYQFVDEFPLDETKWCNEQSSRCQLTADGDSSSGSTRGSNTGIISEDNRGPISFEELINNLEEETGLDLDGSGSESEITEPSQSEVEEEQPTSNAGSLGALDFERFIKVINRNGMTFVQETIQNNLRTTQKDIAVVKDFTTEILQSAYDLESIHDFTIIRENPIIAFSIEKLDYLETQTLSYAIPGTFTKEQIRSIQTNISANTIISEAQIALQAQQQETLAQENLIIESEEVVVDNKTQLKITVDLGDDVSSVKEVEIEQFIPKCLIAEIDEQILRAGLDEDQFTNVRIKEADPLLVWTFAEIQNGQELTLELEALREEDCDDEVKIKALAKEVIKKNYEIDNQNLFKSFALTITVMALIAILFIFATKDHFKHENPHINRLSKIILHKRHSGASDDDIIAQLEQNQEEEDDVYEAYKHVNEKSSSKWFYHFSENSIEIFIFIVLFILNVMDFTGIQFFGTFDWVKKIISWMLMLLIFYRADITRIFFNVSKPVTNLSIIIAMFMMHLKNLVTFAEQLFTSEQISFIADLYKFILTHEEFIRVELFFIGASILIITIVHLVLTTRIREGGIYYLFTKYEKPHTIYQYIARMTKITILFFILYNTVFNRVLEWLAISIDSAIFVVFILVFLTIILNIHVSPKHKLLSSMSHILSHNLTLIIVGSFYVLAVIHPFISEVLYYGLLIGLVAILVGMMIIIFIQNMKQHFSGLKHMSTAIDSTYMKFLKLFKYPQTLFIGLSGLFILQQIVEIGIYIIPNITGRTSEIYTSASEETLLSFFSESSIITHHLFTLTLPEQVTYIIGYTLSLIGFTFLFFVPIYIWYLYFSQRGKQISQISLLDTDTRVAKIITYLGIPTMIVSILTNVLSIRPIESIIQEIGIYIVPSQLLWDMNTIYIAIGATLIYAFIIHFIRKIGFLLTCIFGVFASLYFYFYPYLISLSTYIFELIQTVSNEFTLSNTLQIILIILFIIDLIIIYILGSLTIVYFILPVKVKKGIILILQESHGFKRFFFLSSSMHYLPYYDDAHEHVSGNIIHKIEKYIRVELEHGHHIETIMLQLRLHKYPDKIIQTALTDDLANEHIQDEIEHIRASSVSVSNVRKLTHFLEKHKYTFDEAFQEFEDKYTYTEIKLAYRLASNNFKDKITPSIIESIEINELHGLLQEMVQIKGNRNEKMRKLVEKGYDPELVLHILDAHKQSQVNVEKAKELILLLEKQSLTVPQLVEKGYSLDEISYATKYLMEYKHQQEHLPYINQYRQLKIWVQKVRNSMSEQQIRQVLTQQKWPTQFIDSVISQNTDDEEELLRDIEHEYFLIKN